MAGTIVAGGDIKQLTVGGREFTVEPDAALKVSLGGKNNEAKLAGNMTTIITQKSKLAGFSDATVVIAAGNKDLEYLQNLENLADAVGVVLTLADGTTYAGQLMVVGELDVDTAAGTISFEMRGSIFEQI